MGDPLYEFYRKSVWQKIEKEDKSVIPAAWWDTVIAHYYRMGYSEEETVRVVLETMKK